MPKLDGDTVISGNPKMVRNVNKAAILNFIREYQPVSRIQLTQLSELNKSTVTRIVADLIEEKFVAETHVGESTGGRRPIMLTLTSSEYAIGAVDFDPEFTHIAVADLEAKIKKQKLIQTNKKEPEKFIKQCIQELLSLGMELKGFGVQNIGISVPGIVDTTQGRIVFAPDLGWKEIDLRKLIYESCPSLRKGKIMVENEANSSALAEQWFGTAMKNHSNIVFISEGIGTGIIFEKKLFEGSNDSAGQFGHMTLFANGERCVCGNQGCWEVYASNEATVKRYYGKSVQKPGENINTEIHKIIKNANDGDKVAIQVIKETGKYLGIGISNILKGIDPEVIILGGAITNAWPIVYPEIKQEIKQRLFFNFYNHVQILPCSLKKRSSLVGAITLIIREIFSGYRIIR